ncbi:MAG: flagellar biosynthesis protein FlgJ [Legionellaceae bacterium]|nr:flagellar biosynthesis protein FlgJ [Legionellaceae bacterium]
MDVSAVTITLHPLAKDALFKDYQTLRYIFSNVLGQVETDYLSIALIDKGGRLFFLSSNPSIEQNLIEKELWQFDGCFQPEFIYKDEMSSWFDLYHSDYAKILYRYKQANQGFEKGISIPSDFEEYRVVFSFGFKSDNPFFQQQIKNQQRKLVAMGKYCLREIMQSIELPNRHQKPNLELIINNQVNYENHITER